MLNDTHRPVPVTLMDGPSAGIDMTIDFHLLNGLVVINPSCMQPSTLFPGEHYPIAGMSITTSTYRIRRGEFFEAVALNRPVRLYVD